MLYGPIDHKNNTYLIYWIYGTVVFDGKEFVIDGATQAMCIL